MLFKQVDTNLDGMVNEEEFRELLTRLQVLQRQEEIEFLLQSIDPYNNQRMTYSEVVHLLSSHMVPKHYDDD